MNVHRIAAVKPFLNLSLSKPEEFSVQFHERYLPAVDKRIDGGLLDLEHFHDLFNS